jgi:hypothetical protein
VQISLAIGKVEVLMLVMLKENSKAGKMSRHFQLEANI